MTSHRNLLQSVALLAPLLMVQASTADMVYRGLLHAPQGGAVLAAQADGLSVSNLGSSGQDGVSIALPQASGWEAHWQPLDPADALPVGAYVQSEISGTAGTVSDGLLGSWTLTKAASGTYAVTADFSPLGASTVTLEVYNGTTLVTTLTGQSGALANVNGCVDDDHWGHPTPAGPDGLPGRWGGALTFLGPRTFSFSGSASVQGDRLVILPEGAPDVSSLTRARVLASGIAQISLDSESHSLQYAGLLHGSLGQAGLSIVDGKLTVSNIGSSGQDGVEINLRGLTSARSHNLYFPLFEDDGTLAFTGFGTVGTLSDQPVGTATRDYAGDIETLGFDYSAIGAPTYTLRIYNGKQLVYEGLGKSGGSVKKKRDKFPYRLLPFQDGHLGEYIEGPQVWHPMFGWTEGPMIFCEGYSYLTYPAAAPLEVIGGPKVMGNKVLAIPESPAPPVTVSGVSRLKLQVSGGISSLQIEAESLGSAHSAASALGQATFVPDGSNLTVSNLGSSGQDGVSFALSDAAAWDAEWQPLDLSDTLPVGAYVQSEAFGNAGTLSDSLLGSWRMTKRGTGNYEVTADYSPLGSSTVTVQVYNGTTLVASKAGQSGVLGMLNGCVDDDHHGNPVPTKPFGPFGGALTMFGPVEMILHGESTPVMGDRFVILPEGAATVSALTRVTVRTSGVPQLVITSEATQPTVGTYHNRALEYLRAQGLWMDGVTRFTSANVTQITAAIGTYLQAVGFAPTETDAVTTAVLQDLTNANLLYTDAGTGTVYFGAPVVSDQFVPYLMAHLQAGGVVSAEFVAQMNVVNQMVVNRAEPSAVLAYVTDSFAGSLSDPADKLPASIFIDTYKHSFSYWEDPSHWSGTGGAGSASLKPGDGVILADGAGALYGLLLGPIGSIVYGTAFSIIANHAEMVAPSGTTGHHGLVHTATGTATLDVKSNRLIVSNLGSSGQDGVSIALPQMAAWDAHWQPLDPTGALPVGAYVQSEILGTAGTVSDGLLGSWKLTKADAGRYAVTADFTPLGASTVTLMVYNGTTLVATLTGQSGVLANVNGCVDDDHWGNPTPDGPFGLPGRWGGALTFLDPRSFTFPGADPGADPVLGDRLVILPEGGAAVNSLSATRLLASGIPQITMDEELHSVQYAGFLHGSLGQAGLNVADGKLTVSNIGSSGQDGVEIKWSKPSARKHNIYYQAPPAEDGKLTFSGLGSTDAQAEQVVCQTSLEYASDTTTLAFDYSSIGSSTYTLRIYNGKQLVHESSGHPSGSASVVRDRFKYKQLPLDDVHMGWYEDGPEYWNGTFWVSDSIWHPGYTCDTMPGGQTNRVIGGPSVFGDLVLAIPENPTATVVAASRCKIQASGGISSLEIGAESLSSVHSTASSLGQATFIPDGTNLTISNLGSSGQDGVSLALANVAGWAGHWQPLDPTDALPVGAYLQSEIVGATEASGAAGSPGNILLGSWRMTKAATGSYAVTADFAPLGASTVTVLVYQGADLMTTLTGQSGTLATVNGCVDDDHWGNPTPTGPNGIPGRWGGALTFRDPRTFAFTGAASVQGDRLVILPEGGSDVSSLAESRLLASGIAQLTLDEEQIYQPYAGLLHGSLGQAGLDIRNGLLTAYNLGSSGQDGVEIHLPAPTGRRLNLYYQVPAADGTLTFTGLGSTNAASEQEVGKTTIASAGETATVAFDYSSIGATTYTLRIYNGKQLVYEGGSYPSGSPCIVRDGFKYKRLYGEDVHMGWYEEGPEYFNGTFWVSDMIWHPGYSCDSTPGAQSNRVVGGPTVIGDLVIAIPVNPTVTVSAASRFKIQAGGQISNFQISAESLTSNPVSPLPYSVWANGVAATAGITVAALGGPQDDCDHDGSNNLLEYAFSSDPLDSSSRPAITSGRSTLSVNGTSDEYLTLSCKHPADRLMPVGQASDDLQSWTTAVQVSRVTQPDGSVLDTWRTPDPIHSKPRYALRLLVPLGD